MLADQKAVLMVVELLLTGTVWLLGVVQPLIVLKLTVWLPTDRFVIVAPLVCHIPPSTCHCAPAVIAAAGLMVTCNEPSVGIAKESYLAKPLNGFSRGKGGPDSYSRMDR